jgi:hypothetical protein
MSGPIVRKYGFPNFEKIFGDRPLQHGVEDETNGEVEHATETGRDSAPAQAEAHSPESTVLLAPPALSTPEAIEESQPELAEAKPASKAKPKAAKAPKAEGTAKPKAAKKK